MELRLADPDDAAAIREVARASWDVDYPDIVSRETIPDAVEEWYAVDHLQSELARPDSIVALATAGDEVEGFAHATVDGEVGYVLRLYVAPDSRGEGVGSDLLAVTIDELAARGVDRVRAMVLAANDPGNAFYRAAGFSRVDSAETVVGGEPHEETVYERSLE